MSRASRVPRDSNMSPEVRKFLDGVERSSSYISQDGVADFPELYEDGKRAFVQTGNATGGLSITPFDHGTPANGATITPDPSVCQKQTVTNNASGFTIAATSEVGDLELRVINGASAGNISFSGFDKQWTGDSLTTTNGHQFVIFIYGYGDKAAYLIKALQ